MVERKAMDAPAIGAYILSDTFGEMVFAILASVLPSCCCRYLPICWWLSLEESEGSTEPWMGLTSIEWN